MPKPTVQKRSKIDIGNEIAKCTEAYALERSVRRSLREKGNKTALESGIRVTRTEHTKVEITEGAVVR